MAKEKKVPLNRLVTSETFGVVKRLAVDLKCSEGVVIDQAVEFFDAHNGGEERVVVSYPPAKVPEAPSAPASESDPKGIPGVTKGLPADHPETSRERVVREKAERDVGARARSSIGDDPNFCVDPEFVQD